jgi:heme exporter protein A
MNTLQLNQLSFERNNQFLFQNIHCQLSQGDLLQVRGANGSGKSTLLRILAGYIEVENNSVLWNNQCIAVNRHDYQQQLHYLGHQNGIKPALTVAENLQLSTALSRKNNSSPIEAAVKKTGLAQLLETPARNLSAGLLRRLALTRLLLNPQKLWILDEPATALDQAGQALLLHLLREHQSLGGITILATHQDLNWGSEMKTINLGEQDD